MLHRLAIIVCLALLVPAGVLAQPSAQRTPASLGAPSAAVAPPLPAECASVAASVSERPDDVDLVVVLEHCNQLRGSPWGEAVGKLLAGAGQLDSLTKAWDGLADQLGWDRDETFDRLLGQRIILVTRAVGEKHDRRWAIMSDVSADTERRLKERLLAAPRAIVEGHQILSLENGQYELASHHSVTFDARVAKPTLRQSVSDRVTLILGPTGRGELFDELLSSLARATTRPAAAPGVSTPGTLGSRPVFKQACEAGGLTGAEVLILASLDTPDGKAPWSDFFLLAGQRIKPDPAVADAAPAGPAWHSRILVRQQARREKLLRTEPTSDAAFRSLAAGSMLVMVQNVSLPDVLGPWSWKLGSIGQMIPMPDEAKKAMTPQQALVCRATEPDSRISCTFAMRTADTRETARTLDGPIAAWISRIEKQLGFEAPPVCDYDGLAPGAVRISPVGAGANPVGAGGAAGGGDGAIPLLSSKPLTVSWAYPSRPADALADKAPGWWAMNVSQRTPRGFAPPAKCPSAGDLLRADAAALTADPPPGAETARWVCLATAHPRVLEAMLPSAVPDLDGFRSAMKRIEQIDLRLLITDVGDIQGDFDIRLPAAE
ncbi:MAG TPA: hypothetical protein VHC70_03865 [Phycisphaerales bacterium]|nr:hypothetical protein [Phycisphaerales bacterium]